LCTPPSTGQAWLEALPDEFQDVRIEVHQPEERKKLAYLATTRLGRRIYLNRTAVDADQLVILTRRSYDSLLGYAGGAEALFPGLSDEATQRELRGKLSLAAPGGEPWPSQREAAEVAWLLGVPFLIQVIEGSDGAIVHVIAGPIESSAEGQRLLDARWRGETDRPADVVLAALGGDPERHTFADLARALWTAARVVKAGGKIIVLSDADPELGPSFDVLRSADGPHVALKRLMDERPADLEAGFLWASAAQHAQLYLLSRLDPDAAEELFTTPLEHAGQAQRLLQGRCLVLPDAHRMMVVVAK
jgi:nickel-dependent lactate racemase